MSPKSFLKLGAVMLLSMLVFAVHSPLLAAECEVAGTFTSSDPIAFIGPLELEAGMTITITAYNPPGGETLIALATYSGAILDSLSSSPTNSISFTASQDEVVLVILLWCNCVPTPAYKFTVSISDCSGAGPLATNLLDGRVNDLQDRDVAAPVAIYDGSIEVYGIDPVSGDGHLDIRILDEQIEAVGVPVDAPVLLAQGKNAFTGIDIYVYRLPTGEFQVNTHYADGKAYIFLWDSEGVKSHQAW